MSIMSKAIFFYYLSTWLNQKDLTLCYMRHVINKRKKYGREQITIFYKSWKIFSKTQQKKLSKIICRKLMNLKSQSTNVAAKNAKMYSYSLLLP